MSDLTHQDRLASDPVYRAEYQKRVEQDEISERSRREAKRRADAGEAGLDVSDDPAGSSWSAVDLEQALDADTEAPTPTVARCKEGKPLFYPGRINGLAGASGSGKSWTAQVATVQQLELGNHVVYVDLEDTATGTVARLLALGAKPEQILELFHYVSPDGRFDVVAAAAFGELLDEHHPTLVVIDSTGEALALDGKNPNADEEVAVWFKRLPTIAAKRGAAVVLLDHVVKDDNDGGLWPIGSQRKRAAVSGAQYVQRLGKPFSRDTPGDAMLVCAKDRHGTYRISQRVAHLTVTPEDEGRTVIADLVAVTHAAATEEFEPTTLMEKVSNALETVREPLTYNGITERVVGKRTFVRKAVDALIKHGNVTTSPAPHNGTFHTLVKPYRAPQPGNHSPDSAVPEDPVDRFRSKDREPGTSQLAGSRNQSGTSGNQSGSPGEPAKRYAPQYPVAPKAADAS